VARKQKMSGILGMMNCRGDGRYTDIAKPIQNPLLSTFPSQPTGYLKSTVDRNRSFTPLRQQMATGISAHNNKDRSLSPLNRTYHEGSRLTGRQPNLDTSSISNSRVHPSIHRETIQTTHEFYVPRDHPPVPMSLKQSHMASPREGRSHAPDHTLRSNTISRHQTPSISDKSSFIIDNIHYNDLFSMTDELRKRSEQKKEYVVQQLQDFLQNRSIANNNPIVALTNSKQSTGVSFADESSSHQLESFSQKQHVTIKKETADLLLKNFMACAECSIAHQEHTLSSVILKKISAEITQKLRTLPEVTSDMKKFEYLFNQKRDHERTKIKECYEQNKKLIGAEHVLAAKKRRAEFSKQDFGLKVYSRDEQLKHNRRVQIKSSLSELDFLYKNDSQSLLEDVPKYLNALQYEIDYYKEMASENKGKSKVDPRLIEMYNRLKAREIQSK